MSDITIPKKNRPTHDPNDPFQMSEREFRQWTLNLWRIQNLVDQTGSRRVRALEEQVAKLHAMYGTGD